MKKKLSAAIVKNESDEDQSDNEVTMIENGFGDDSIDEGNKAKLKTKIKPQK